MYNRWMKQLFKLSNVIWLRSIWAQLEHCSIILSTQNIRLEKTIERWETLYEFISWNQFTFFSFTSLISQKFSKHSHIVLCVRTWANFCVDIAKSLITVTKWKKKPPGKIKCYYYKIHNFCPIVNETLSKCPSNG